MSLPIEPPFPPMEALSVDTIPAGPQWQYEPKWDGFRCLAFRDREKVELQSKSGQTLSRYFPEIVQALQNLNAKKFVLDGELVIPVGEKLSFDDLLQRIHPAASRVEKLSKQTPALFIVFDLLVDSSGKLLAEKNLTSRRKALDDFAARFFDGNETIRLSPATTEISTAREWFDTVGLSLDGVIAKRIDLPYESGNRHGMQKIKKIRTADCVIGGFRYAAGKSVVGSLLLGLYDENNLLQHVGFCSGLKAAEKPALTKKLEKLVKPPGFTGRSPGGPSRWASERSGEWQPMAPKLVIEVSYDHFSGDRFRHGTKLLRWRPDKAPEQCRLDQVVQPSSRSLRLLQ